MGLWVGEWGKSCKGHFGNIPGCLQRILIVSITMQNVYFAKLDNFWKCTHACTVCFVIFALKQVDSGRLSLLWSGHLALILNCIVQCMNK